MRNVKPKLDWFTKEPEDPTKPIEWNNKQWYWCGKKTGRKCERCVQHKPDELE